MDGYYPEIRRACYREGVDSVIMVLPPQVIDQIAAGEVIERLDEDDAGGVLGLLAVAEAVVAVVHDGVPVAQVEGSEVMRRCLGQPHQFDVHYLWRLGCGSRSTPQRGGHLRPPHRHGRVLLSGG